MWSLASRSLWTCVQNPRTTRVTSPQVLLQPTRTPASRQLLLVVKRWIDPRSRRCIGGRSGLSGRTTGASAWNNGIVKKTSANVSAQLQAAAFSVSLSTLLYRYTWRTADTVSEYIWVRNRDLQCHVLRHCG